MSNLDAVLGEQTAEQKAPFGKYEEEAIASLLVDHPEFFANIVPHFNEALFTRLEVKYVITNILDYYKEFIEFPTRGMLRDRISKQLTVDDSYVDDILAIVDRPSNPREIPAMRASVVEWARHQAYEILFNAETIAKFHAKEYAYIEDVFERARRVDQIRGQSMWFFDDLEKLFEEDQSERLTTGIEDIDKALNDGGPARGDLCVWMAPTGVGKSIMLINNAVANSMKGYKALVVTLELSSTKSAIRLLGAMTKKSVATKTERTKNQEDLIKTARHLKQSVNAGDIVIHELPPDEVSVDAIYALLDDLRRERGFIPDVICLDYLDLLISRRASDNDDQYGRQKAVSVQVRGLAKKTNTVVFSATQTNRGGNDTKDSKGEKRMIGVSNIAESYGKSMAMDYLVSLNQTPEEYAQAHGKDGNTGSGVGPAHAFIAKNRNGPKGISVPIKINYLTMEILQMAG
jgi:replicative DNA helicase